MKNNLRKALSGILACLFACMLMPIGAAALPAGLEYDQNGKLIPENTDIRTADSLSDGEVYTYTTVAGSPLPSTDFTVGMSALGQKYRVTETTVVPTVTVLVVDTSGSMDFDIVDTYGTNTNEKSRMQALKEAANIFVDSVVSGSGGTNYVAVVTYNTYAYRTLTFSNSNTTLKNTISSLSAGGGTNTHGGLIAAYKMINNPTSFGLTAAQVQNAAYSVVFMSDGEPTYYYTLSGSPSVNINSATVYNNLGFNTSGQLTKGTYSSSYTLNYTGPGNDSNSSTISNAQAAANIIKTTGVEPTVYSVYIYNEDYSDARATMEAIASSADNTYTPDDSDALTDAFEDIAVSIRSTAYTPIEEVDLSSPVSYVTMSYQIGAGYMLPDSTMTVSLGGVSYTMTRHGTDYTYDVSPSVAGYNVKLTKLVLTVEDGVVTWQIPASVLPCNSPEPVGNETQTLAAPITLYFTLRFDESAAGLAAQTYPTSSSITASFYPTADNPFYYTGNTTGTAQSLAANSTDTYTVTDYYRATYPYPGSDNYYQSSRLPELTSFALAGSSAGPYTYTSLSNVAVTNFTNNSSKDWNDTVTMRYTNPDDPADVRSIPFTSSTKKTATLSFTTTNQNDPSVYSDVSFSDGNSSYSNIGITKSGSNLTVNYDNNNVSIVFQNAGFTTQTQTETVEAKFTSGNPVNLTSFKVDGVNRLSGVTNIQAVQTGTVRRTYLLIFSKQVPVYKVYITYNGYIYEFSDIDFGYSGDDTVTKNITRTLGTYYTVSASQNYYVTSTSSTRTVTENIINYRFVYDNAASPNALTVQTKPPSTWTTEGAYTKNTNTSIAPNGQEGYTVRQLSGGGTLLTTTTYYVENNTLYKQVSTSGGQNGVNLATGIVTHTLTTTGAMVLHESLTAEECIPSATLKSLTGTNLATASSSGEVTLAVTLTVSGNTGTGIVSPTFNLGCSASAAPDTFTCQYVDAAGNPAVIPANLAPGTHKLYFKITASYSNPQAKPSFCTVSLQSVSFTLPSGAARELTPTTDHQVKVVLITAAGH